MGIAGNLFQLVFGRAKLPASRGDSKRLEDWVISGNYRVLNRMGSGGTASVLRATDIALNREVALKILLENETTNEDLTRRFLEEGKILASLRHPNVVMVYSLGVDERLKFPFLVMEMVHGATLEDHLEDFRRNPLLLFREMITILEAIHFCHQKKIVHLDLKPSNLMIDQNGQIKIIDFGIAMPIHNQKGSPFALGTAYYMAPEQFEFDRTFSPETDIYSLGIILWELLTGKVPFAEPAGTSDPFEALEHAHRKLTPPFEEIEALPHARPLVPLLTRMLAKTPGQRPTVPEITQLLKQEVLAQGGQIGDRFEVHRELNREAHSRLLLGFDRSLQQKVCIEILTGVAGGKLEQAELFLQRAGKLTQLGHPCFPRILAFDREPITRLPYLVQEKSSGSPLADILSLLESHPVRLLALFRRILLGIWRAHEGGFGHGLIRTDTILVNGEDAISFIRCHCGLSDTEAMEKDIRAVPDLGLEFCRVCKDGQEAESLAPEFMKGFEGLCKAWLEALQKQSSLDLKHMALDLEELWSQHHLQTTSGTAITDEVLGTTPPEKMARIKRLVEAGNPLGIKVLMHALRGETDPLILAAILPALARLERRSELPAVLPFLAHSSAQVRLAAIEAIHLTGEVGACLHLFDLFEDPDKRVRTSAASTLKNFGEAGLKEQLQTFVLFGLPDQQVKAIFALRFFPSEEHLTLIELMSQSENPEAAQAARETRLAILTAGLDGFDKSSLGHPVALTRLGEMENHTIICGYGRKGQLLVQSLLARDEPCVVIEADTSQTGLELAKAQGIPTIVGSATYAPFLMAAGVTRAKQIFVVTNDDDVNLEIALKAKMLLGNMARPSHLAPLQCLAHVFSVSLACMADLFAPIKARSRERFQVLSTAPGFELRLFNIFENAARQMLAANLPPTRLLQEQMTGKPLHILILGIPNLGVNLAIQAATQLQGPDPGLLKITIVDQAHHFKGAAFRFHYPNIDRIISLNLVPLAEKDLTPDSIERIAGLDPFSAVFICHQNLNLELRLGTIVRQIPSIGPSVPILLVGRIPSSKVGLMPVVAAEPSAEPFARYDVFSSTCRVEAILQEPLDSLARAMHAHFFADLPPAATEAEDDPRRNSWERLRGDVKEHFRAQADHLPVKMRTIGCEVVAIKAGGRAYVLSETDVTTLARLEFRRRVVETLFSAGSSTSFLDTLRNADKEPPTWAYLSPAHKEELYQQVRSIPALLGAIGLQIQRTS